jgi:hypothetical protein|tara:strand:- start:117 stop:251 length:135 start_codon:yes stop_codon:yes gene_type:complete
MLPKLVKARSLCYELKAIREKLHRLRKNTTMTYGSTNAFFTLAN